MEHARLDSQFESSSFGAYPLQPHTLARATQGHMRGGYAPNEIEFEHALLTSQRLNVWCAKSAYASPTSTSARPKLRTVPTDRVQGHIVTRNTSGPLQQSRTAARRPLVTRENGHFQSLLRASASRTVGRTSQARMLREPRSPQRMQISPRRAAYVL